MMSKARAEDSAANPPVTVIIVTWNGRPHLEHCLPALLAQTRPAEQLIVVDNASDDDTVHFLAANFPQVEVVANGANCGFAGGNGRGLAAASGSYIVLLNNDTKPEPDWLENLVRCANEHSDAGMVASHMTDWLGEYTDSAGDAVNVLGRAHQRHKGRPITDPPEAGYVFSACAGAALYKRAMIEDVGFLDESFFMNVEDSDLAFRAQLRGWKAYFCPRAVVRHRVSASQLVGSPSNVYFNTRNYVWCYMKNMPAALVAKYGWLLLADLSLKAILAAQKGNLGAYLKGLGDGIRGLSRRLPERRRIQAGRILGIAELEASLSFPRPLSRLFGEQ